MQLDVRHPIQLSDELLSRHANNLRTIHGLGTGLNFICGCVARAEAKKRAELQSERSPGISTMQWGSDDENDRSHDDLIECMFRWYAVTACDLVRNVAWMAEFPDDDARNDYVDEVLGAVKAFRDKVAAHTAGATRNKHDNPAERLLSTFRHITWNHNRYQVGIWGVVRTSGGETSNSKAIGPWGVTTFHEQLSARYPWMRVAVEQGSAGETPHAATESTGEVLVD